LRSLNVAMASAIAVGEALRQVRTGPHAPLNGLAEC
jgi:tRNA(Leu) C34 or U34 (ribose-2'-O)-methylase TrmL